SLQQAPEVLQAVGMDLSPDVLLGVVDRRVLIELGEPTLGVLHGGIGVEIRSLLYGLDHFATQIPLTQVPHHDGPHPTGLPVAPAFQHPEYRGLIHTAGPANDTIALGPMHKLGFTANEG